MMHAGHPSFLHPLLSMGILSFSCRFKQQVCSRASNSIDITDAKKHYASSNRPEVSCSCCSFIFLVTWGFAHTKMKPLGNHQPKPKPLAVQYSFMIPGGELNLAKKTCGSAKVAHSQGRSDDPTRQACGVGGRGLLW